MGTKQRWYDQDPILKEALELLQLQSEETKSDVAVDFITKMQEEVAADVIERVYEMVTKFQGKGSRWYDNDPVMMEAIEFLRAAPPKVQRVAALKLLLSLEQQNDEK